VVPPPSRPTPSAIADKKSSSAAEDFCSAEYRYVVSNGRVLLVGTSRIVVGFFADANAR
jgi:hypothetical protein